MVNKIIKVKIKKLKSKSQMFVKYVDIGPIYCIYRASSRLSDI